MRLSICIATYNRARFIGETLESIVTQLRAGVEVVIVDGASPDDTSAVVAEYLRRSAAIRYIRESTNSGVDGDYDKAVGHARGEHCWLVPDDDVLAPGAIDKVLRALENGTVDLLVVDAEIRDVTLKKTLKSRRLPFSGEKFYAPSDAARFLADVGDALSFIGSVVIRRRSWLERERTPYFGTLFIHVGVIFQGSAFSRVKVLGDPLLWIRYGNAMWTPRSFEIWGFKWPQLIWSFEGQAEAARRHVTPQEPWRGFRWLVRARAMGGYSMQEYRRYFAKRQVGAWRIVLLLTALMPGKIVNFIGACALALTGAGAGEASYELAKCSRFSNFATRLLLGLWLADILGSEARRRS